MYTMSLGGGASTEDQHQFALHQAVWPLPVRPIAAAMITLIRSALVTELPFQAFGTAFDLN
jgi:hypothetical protein